MSTLVKVAMATPIMAPMTRPLRGAAVLLFECVLMGGHRGAFVVVWESQASPDTVAARVSLFRVGHREAAVPAINHAIANIDRHNHDLISCPQDEDFNASRIEEKNQAKAYCNIKPGDHRSEHSHHCYATHPNDVSPVIMQDISSDCAEHPPNHRENNRHQIVALCRHEKVSPYTPEQEYERPDGSNDGSDDEAVEGCVAVLLFECISVNVHCFLS